MIQINIKMPNNCYLCPLNNSEFEYCPIDIEERYVYRYYLRRPEWCPLIEVKNET